MKQKIINICKDLEQKHDIKIIFAIENGSRAWRFDSKDSDYDVRFVFARPVEEYITIKRPKDVINVAFDKDMNPCTPDKALIDISGFDIFKYLTLLSSSNPTTIEWLVSDIIYCGTQNKVFKEFALNNFNRIALYHHYKSLCRNNYEKYIKTGNHVTYKKYLYVFRGLICARWVSNKDSVPPIIFTEAVDGLNDVIPKDVIDGLKDIIKIKSDGNEKDAILQITYLDNYVEEFLKDDSDMPEKRQDCNKEILDKELKRIVLG